MSASAINPVLIYGPDGSPVSTSKFLNATQNGPNVESWPTLYEDISKSVPVYDRRFIVSANRKLYANRGTIREATDARAICSVGNAWLPTYGGSDPRGKAAEKWLREEWLPACEIRGSEYDWQTSLYLESTNIDHSGDIGVLLTYKGDPEYPWPCFQLVPAHRIGFRSGLATGIVQGDECDGATGYRGRKYEDGVIFGDHGDPVAYALLGEDAGDDKVVSTWNFVLLKEPMFVGQSRGFPIFLHAIREARTAMKASEYEEFACLLASSIALIEENESAAPENKSLDTSFDGDGNENQVPTNGLSTQSYMGGLIRYLRAGSGANLKAFMSERPSAQWDSFQSRLDRVACAPVWPLELILEMKGIPGPAVRSIQGRARRVVKDRQSLLFKVAKRKVLFALAIAMKTGRIEPFMDWTNWGFVMPPLLTIDDGRDSAARLSDYFAGFTNLTEILEEDSRELEPHLRQRAREIVLRERVRREESDAAGIEGWEIPPEEMSRAPAGSAPIEKKEETNIEPKEQTDE